MEKTYDYKAIVSELQQLLHIKTIPIGMKGFKTVEEMEKVKRLRRPDRTYTTDQMVAQATRLGWTVGFTADDLAMPQCGAVLGLHPQDDQWLSGQDMAGVWFETESDAACHQCAMDTVSFGTYNGVVVSPLQSARLNPPDICLFYGTPGQMILFINGLQWSGYRKFEWGIVGESACADSWGRAMKTGEPSLSLPCYAERRFGGVEDDELLMAISIDDLVKGIEGMKQLGKNGFRYPIPPYGIQQDATEGLSASYNK